VCFFDTKIVKDKQDSRHGNRHTGVPWPEFEHDTPFRPSPNPDVFLSSSAQLTRIWKVPGLEPGYMSWVLVIELSRSE
jgi:hypothetical protein